MEVAMMLKKSRGVRAAEYTSEAGDVDLFQCQKVCLWHEMRFQTC